MNNKETSPLNSNAVDEARSEGNQCIALGLGVGALGAAASLALGATCPLCLVIAPGLVGAGLLKRRSTSRAASQRSPSPTVTEDGVDDGNK
jgi:hypothetical protein